MQVHNANRDLFRFIRLPLDLSWVSCPVYSRPGSSEVIEAKLPMYDPHELLEYLWKTGRLKVKTSTLQIHSCVHYNFYRFCGFISYPIKKNMWVSNFEFPIRKYWEHWSSVASWAASHPGGDEARYSETHGDKFIALCLGSPLVFKQRDWEIKKRSDFSLGICSWSGYTIIPIFKCSAKPLPRILCRELSFQHCEICNCCWELWIWTLGYMNQTVSTPVDASGLSSLLACERYLLITATFTQTIPWHGADMCNMTTFQKGTMISIPKSD